MSEIFRAQFAKQQSSDFHLCSENLKCNWCGKDMCHKCKFEHFRGDWICKDCQKREDDIGEYGKRGEYWSDE